MTPKEKAAGEEIDRQIEAIKADVVAKVQGSPGWMGVHVFPTEAPVQPYSFSYTIGLWPQHPEIIVVNLPQRIAKQVLGTLHDRVRAGETFEPDKLYAEVLRNYDVAIQDVPPDAQADHFRWADWFHQEHGEWPFATVQMVWPDPHGKFPWEPGYEAEACPQPVFATGVTDDA